MRNLVAIILFFTPIACSADAIDDYIQSEMANQRLPGMALAVIREGEPVIVRTYGLANVEHNVSVTTDTAFRLASISKQITATAVLILVEAGKVGLDDSIAKYIPDCPNSWHDITIRHLLTHTSGMRRESPITDSYNNQSNLELIRGAYSEALLSRPGAQFWYSNLGYSMLGEVITQASGQLWSDFVIENIFDRLDMKSTRTTDYYDLIENRAEGYVFTKFVLHRARPLFQVRPAGGYVSTILDMIKWDAAVSNLTLISRESRDTMWAPAILHDGTNTKYAMGWWNDDVGGYRRIRHGGNNPGFRSWYTRFVDYDVSVIVLVNGFNARPDAIAREVAGHFIDGLRIDRTTIELSVDELQRYVGEYRVDEDNILTINIDGNGLSVESSRLMMQSKMLPEVSGTFFISKDESYVFGIEGGKVTHLTIEYGDNQTLRADRMR